MLYPKEIENDTPKDEECPDDLGIDELHLTNQENRPVEEDQ